MSTRLKNLDLISTFTVDVVLRKFTKEEYLADKENLDNMYQGHVYHAKNHLRTCLGTIYNFSDYPILDIELKSSLSAVRPTRDSLSDSLLN